MILLSILLIITIFLEEEADDYAELARCIKNIAPDEHRQIALVSSYVILKQCIHSLVWLASYYLLIYQYRKGLSETWYSHKMFWNFSLVADASSFVYSSLLN